MDGGGYCNAIATDPLSAGHAAAAGDVWGEFVTQTGGALWSPTMIGATSIGDIYGRAVAYSQREPGLRYFGIGVLKDADPKQGYLGAVKAGLDDPASGETTTSASRAHLPDGSAHDLPRAVGRLIAVDYDRGSGIEYLYVAQPAGPAALRRTAASRSRRSGCRRCSRGRPGRRCACAPTGRCSRPASARATPAARRCGGSRARARATR